MKASGIMGKEITQLFCYSHKICGLCLLDWSLIPSRQVLTKNSKLASLRISTNYSSGFYKLRFSDDNVLQLLYEGLEMSGVYWPDPGKTSWQAGRSTYNNSKNAVQDPFGYFTSTDKFWFRTADMVKELKE
ncbi:hypothetical protein RND71_038340 [Anisodus tanguticus]|uniref:Uncharacterized protein n=1 Tax=Anisodus tanguticus TaxID=243964 RepID=A0AAE1QYU8_9SOLA|nr:hypothetical protein RND71_038340 [Anisodus tanguticus]